MNRVGSEKVDVNKIHSDCIADKLRLINRVITSIYDDAFRPLGITINQMNIIVVVAKFEPANLNQVGKWLHMEKSTLSRNISLMTKNGWLQTAPLGHGRSLEIRLTRQGRALLKKGTPYWEKAQDRVGSMLKKQGVEEVKRIANDIRASAN
ncbi:MAG: MarR family winged helix-turn-helix transcriptional regulator [Thermodesulfobacteriota bacterium]